MSTRACFVDGRALRLGSFIGKGGEGEVFEAAEIPGQAVKIYAKPDREQEAKIQAMIAAGLASRSELIAFPLAVVRDRHGAFLGFTMRLVKEHVPLFELYSPGARKISFPHADYQFLVRTAANVARAVAKVHGAGTVIGDVNESGILISEKAVAALIDADSFQFGEQFPCRVGKPGYTPPELQGIKLDRIVRTTHHDAFGLAVVVFQLLFMGRHPYVGRFSSGDMPLERAISEHRFAYSSRTDTGMKPPPGASRLNDFPEPIRRAFEAAFGRDPKARPTALHWVEALNGLERSLTKCTANPLHFYPNSASTCTWCRMEHSVGMILFLLPHTGGGGATVGDPGAAGFNLTQVWLAIERITIPEAGAAVPVIQTIKAKPSEKARQYRNELWMRRAVGVATIAAAIAVIVWAPAAWLLCIPLGWFGIMQVFGTPEPAREFAARYKRAEMAHRDAVEDWKTRTGQREARRIRGALDAAKLDYEKLPRKQERLLGELHSKRREHQLRRFLEGFPLRRAKIDGIGPGRQATLASYGVDTAAAVQQDRLLNIPGFGPATVASIVAWRRRVEARFVYNPNQTPQDKQEQDRVGQEIAVEAAKLRKTLINGAAKLRAALTAAETRARVPDPVVNRVHQEREQARADLQFLGIALPHVPPVPPSPTPRAVPAPPNQPQRAPTVPSSAVLCPSCGGRMVRRVARTGYRAGRPFMGCARYPACRGTRPV